MGGTSSHERPNTGSGLGPDAPARPQAPYKLRVLSGRLSEVALAHVCPGEEVLDFRQEVGFGVFSHLAAYCIRKSGHVKVRYCVDDVGAPPRDKRPVMDATWRDRLSDAIAASGKSRRAVSLGAGLAASYVHGVLVEGKEPTIGNLAAICDAVPVSLAYVLYGHQISDEDLSIISAMQENPDLRDAILSILRASQSRR